MIVLSLNNNTTGATSGFVLVAHSLLFCVMFCRKLFVFFGSFLPWLLYCLSLDLLVMMSCGILLYCLSLDLRVMTSPVVSYCIVCP